MLILIRIIGEEGGVLTEDYQDNFFSKTKKSNKTRLSDIDKNTIQALNKMDMSYNPASLNYINEKFKDMTLEDKL